MKEELKKFICWSKYFWSIIIIVTCVFLSIQTKAANTTQRTELKQELLNIYYNNDTSVHNIYNYKITVNEFNTLYYDLKYNDGRIIMSAYPANTLINYTTKFIWINTIQLQNTDSMVLSRYNSMVDNINRIMTGIQPEMTDLDKLIYFHDAIVRFVRYGSSGKQSYMAGGALGEGVAVCAGYANALNLLLYLEGIESDYVTGTSLDHGWSYVKLDGLWYHVDPTWDDTRSPKSGKISRQYLLKNDSEMSGNHGVWEVKNITEQSASTVYSNWFMHSIVGDIQYYDGMWYYVDAKSGTIKKSDSQGTNQVTIADCSEWNNVEIESVDGDLIKVNADGIVQMIQNRELSKEDDSTTNSTDDNNSVPDVEEPSSSDNKDENVIEDKEFLNISEVDLNDITSWKSGLYSWITGKYMQYNSRICLNDYVTCDTNTRYSIQISNYNYHLLIRELDENKSFILSDNLKDGDNFTTNSKTKYLAISLYNPSNENQDYASYQKLFANGIEIMVGEYFDTSDFEDPVENTEDVKLPTSDNESLSNEAEGDSTIVPSSTKYVENWNFDEFSNWKTGMYNWTDGAYVGYPQRICAKDYLMFGKERYQVEIANSTYKLLIRELDKNHIFIKSTTLGDGSIFTPDSRAVYLGISLYKSDWETNMTFEKFENLFASGFYARLVNN